MSTVFRLAVPAHLLTNSGNRAVKTDVKRSKDQEIENDHDSDGGSASDSNINSSGAALQSRFHTIGEPSLNRDPDGADSQSRARWSGGRDH